MKRLYKSILGIIFFVMALFTWLIYPVQGVPMLSYHMINSLPETYSIDPGEFEHHMKYLAEQGYTAISLQQLFLARNHQWALPAKPVIITFDDGYQDNYQNALPIMEKYGMRGTVFIITDSVGKPNYLSWDEIRVMQQRNTEIGSHTLTHVKLKELSYADQLKEMAGSKKILEKQLGKPAEFLAYPYGSYNDSVTKALQEAGYLGACSGKVGLNDNVTNPYALKRISIPRPKYGMWEFRLRMLRANVYAKMGR